MIFTKGGWNSFVPYKLFFVAAYNTEPIRAGVWKDSTLLPDQDSAVREIKDPGAEQRVGSFCRFKTTEGQQIVLKIAISLSGYENAEKFLQTEIPGWGIEKIMAEGKSAWEKQLSKIKIETSSEDQKKLFYTALYHTMVMPRDYTGDNPDWSGDKPFWNDQYCLWDTWRTLFPLHVLINPAMVRDNVLSFIDRLTHNGQVRDAFISGKEAGPDQGGNNVDNIIADAFFKGVPGIDWNQAYGVMKFDAEHERKGGGYGGKFPDIYRKQGWIPKGDISTSYTLEYAYNDYCTAMMAKALGKTDDYSKYLQRSNGWINLWDENMESRGYKGFIGSRDWDNKFVPFDPAIRPKPWQSVFYEGSSWTYSYFVPHNIEKLVSLMGGKEKFAERLNFALENDLIEYGNEPSFLALRSFQSCWPP